MSVLGVHRGSLRDARSALTLRVSSTNEVIGARRECGRIASLIVN